jgi:hypothetical protein
VPPKDTRRLPATTVSRRPEAAATHPGHLPELPT